MHTALRYFDDSSLVTCSVEILYCGQDEYGYYLTFSQTVFYPQGGGQPFDQGTITAAGKTVPIHAVKWVGEEIRHYTSHELAAFTIGQEAILIIDAMRRRQNSRFHSAGHLLSLALETVYPLWTAFKGHHYPENAYVEFVSHESNPPLITLEAVNVEIEKQIRENWPISSIVVPPEDKTLLCHGPTRLVRIGQNPYQPCGGTHVKELNELAGLVATKQKRKGNILRINYNL